MALNDIEFLRYLIDYIDSKKEPEPELEVEPEEEHTAPPTIIINVDQGNDDNAESGSFGVEHDPDDVENAIDRDDVFVPPLQAKLEIMKKMAGIEPKNQDLLSDIAAEDEPFEG